MEINDVRVATSAVAGGAGETTFAASIGGSPVWFRVRGAVPELRGDAFVIAALLPAMARGESLRVTADVPVSPALLAVVRHGGMIQDVLRSWCPGLHAVEVSAATVAAPARRPGVAAFFSGGVDSLYTAQRNLAELTHLVYVGGFDVAPSNAAVIEPVAARHHDFARRLGKELVVVVTNLRAFCDSHRVDIRTLYHGSFLASIAHALGCGRTYIAATHAYNELLPWGSHPLLDPLWSTDTVGIVHDGAVRRSDKLKAIVDWPLACETLRVCGQEAAPANCGRCEKCIRTMTGLRLLGRTVATLPPLQSAAPIRRLRITDDNGRSFFADNYAVALASGDTEVAAALHAVLRRHDRRLLARRLDAVLLGGALRRRLGQRAPAGQPWLFGGADS